MTKKELKIEVDTATVSELLTEMFERLHVARKYQASIDFVEQPLTLCRGRCSPPAQAPLRVVFFYLKFYTSST